MLIVAVTHCQSSECDTVAARFRKLDVSVCDIRKKWEKVGFRNRCDYIVTLDAVAAAIVINVRNTLACRIIQSSTINSTVSYVRGPLADVDSDSPFSAVQSQCYTGGQRS